MDEVNGQQILHHPYTIICHSYITIKIKSLQNDMWQLTKVLKIYILKVNNGSSLCNLNGLRIVTHGIIPICHVAFLNLNKND